MGFKDPIVGGIGTLIRDFIQSANYNPGVAGWRIKKDGTAEFQSLTARGDLSGSTLTIPAGAGPGQNRIIIDSNGLSVYDFNDNQLLFIFPSGSAPLQVNDTISIPNGNSEMGLTDTDAQLFCNRTNVVGAHADFKIFDPTAPGNQKRMQISLNGLAHDQIRILAGFLGGYYYEEVIFSQSVAVNSSVLLKTITGDSIYADYASGWNFTTGLWTAPVEGLYDINIAPGGWAATPNYQASIRIEINAVTVAGIGSNVTAIPAAMVLAPQTIIKHLNAGDTLGFRVFQNSAAAQTLTGSITIARRL